MRSLVISSSLLLPFLLEVSLAQDVLPPTVSVWVDPPPKYQCPRRSVYPCNCTKGSDEGIFLECSNTNLASLAVGLAQVKTLIHTLKIESCNIERLFGDVFKSLTVKKLYVLDTPIRDISDNTLDDQAETLEELYITNSWLSRVPPSVKNLTNIKILSIETSRISYLPPGVFDGMRTLVDLKIADGGVETFPDEIFKQLKRLKRLSLYKNNISTLPKNLFKSQGNLEYLDISHNKFPKFEPHFFPDLRRMLWLNASHNEVPAMTGRVFSRNGLLRVLNLNHNKLTSLDAQSLRGMRFMRRLFFSDNLITRVGRGTFRSVTRIGTIDLARNKLTRVDFQMFADLRFIDTIDVAENQITEIQREAFKHLYLTKVNVSHNLIEVIGEGVFRNAENMTVLDMSHNRLVDIVPTAFDENSYATKWILTHNNLTSMSQVPMASMKGIKVLNVSHNQMEDIPKNTFPKLFELHTIDFSHNSLNAIGRSVFNPLFSLRHLHFDHNDLNTLESSTFGKLPSLLDLDLSYNKIERVRRGVLAGLSSIRVVWLDNNRIQDIPTPPISLTHIHLSHNNISSIKGRQPWPAMNSLLYLDLDHNKLGDSITGGRLDNLLVLGYLSIRNNNISSPPWEALRALRSLQKLFLDGNIMTNLTKKAFGRLGVVGQLGLSRNKFNNISLNAFEGLIHLVKLDLSHNNLTYVPPGAFQSLVALRELNLGHNKIEYLQNKTHGLFDDCLSIRKLDLSHNRVAFVTRKMFPENKWIPYRLQWVDLSHNHMPVLTKELLIGTKHLRYLNVSANMLNDVRDGVISNLAALEVLDISHNFLTDKILTDERVGHLANMTVFRVASNRFTKLPLEAIMKMENLKELDLRSNRVRNYYPALNEQIRMGLDLFYDGNPLECNCLLRPVAYWLTSVGRVQGRAGPWDEARCSEPAFLGGRAVGSILEEQFVCENSTQASNFRLNPDVMFREVKRNHDSVDVSWRVSTNEDVADFRLELRQKKFPHSTIFQQDLDYTKRFEVLRPVPYGEEFTLCLLTKSSSGRVRRWRQDQCHKVNPYNTSAAHASSILLILVTALFSMALAH